jgi:predicted transcriptional regulator
MPPGDHVFDKKVNRHQVMVHKNKGKFDVYIDGDKLDTFNSQREAEKAGVTFAKEF